MQPVFSFALTTPVAGSHTRARLCQTWNLQASAMTCMFRIDTTFHHGRGCSLPQGGGGKVQDYHSEAFCKCRSSFLPNSYFKHEFYWFSKKNLTGKDTVALGFTWWENSNILNSFTFLIDSTKTDIENHVPDKESLSSGKKNPIFFFKSFKSKIKRQPHFSGACSSCSSHEGWATEGSGVFRTSLAFSSSVPFFPSVDRTASDKI